jgi:hypothetical protein
VLPASAPLLAAGILGAQGWKTLDMLLVLAGAGAGLAQGQLKGEKDVQSFVRV